MEPDGWKIPKYVYDESTTLSTLLRQFVNANGNRTGDIAAALGIQERTVDDWMRDSPAPAAYNRFITTLWQVARIDVDPIVVMESKKRIWDADPGSRKYVTSARFTTRNQIYEELNRLTALPPYAGGTRQIAWQLGVSDATLNEWTNGKGKPTGDNLDLVILGLSRGLVETGSAANLAFLTSTRMVCGCDPEACLGAKTFEDACRAAFRGPLRGLSFESAGKRLGVAPCTAAMLSRWNESRAETINYGTYFGLIRVLAESVPWSKEYLDRFDVAVRQFSDKKEKIGAVRNPVFGPEGRPRPQAEERAPVPKEPVAIPEPMPYAVQAQPTVDAGKDQAGGQALENHARRLLAVYLDGIAKLEKNFPGVLNGYVPKPEERALIALLIAKWNANAIGKPADPGWIPSDEAKRQIVDNISTIEQVLRATMEMHVEDREEFYPEVAEALEGLFVLFSYRQLRDVSEVDDNMRMRREALGAFRKNKTKKDQKGAK